jgi:hypothetical protein
VVLSIPLVTAQQSYSDSTEELQIIKETALILDDVRFLIFSLVKQVDRELSEQEKVKLLSISVWIRDRIAPLADGSAATTIHLWQLTTFIKFAELKL